uniref:Protein transport protein Sec31A n=1 Tax=Scleropages formosus TaxID=113540 RepID=A0A8C9VWU7_SCLFO
MKLKEIDRTAIQAWSPAQHHPIYLATGTSAQQLDATFSTSASLEIFELDLADLSLDMKPCGTFSSSHRYHRLVWGPHGMDSEAHPSGVLIAGGENGNVILYDPAKIIAGDSEVIIAQNNKHTGPVRALDVNSYQTNLIASGGNESEIYIWDLNNFGSPMTPGPKTQPLEDISCVAWNGQVQHILASASPSGRASVWDLRKNDLIIKVSDHSNRMHCSGLAWNPEVATQLVLASEDDRMPVIQVWDLRFATSPLKVLENHTRGVLAIAWSLADPELLLSCGKDNRILCWNPNTAEVLYELPTSTQWCFDIQWCPRNPALLSAAAFDGHISIYSIMGGNNDCQRQKNTDQLSSSFGNLDPFGTGQALPPLQLPQPSATKSTPTPLKKPPKWIRVPVGASFAFGGKLVTLENVMANPQQPHQPAPLVHVNQVVTETAFLDRSNQLQAAMTAGNFADFCQSKIKAAENEFERTVWSFLKVNFENDTRGKYLELLGYNKEELALKVSMNNKGKARMGLKSLLSPANPYMTGSSTCSADVDGLITQALLTGDFEGAVNLCLHDNRMADSIILAIAGGQELLEKTQKKYFGRSPSKITKLISAVVTRDWQDILETCDLQNWKEALAAIMTYARPEEFSTFCELLGSRLEASGDLELRAQACLCYVCAGNVEKLVACWTGEHHGHSPLSLQDLVEKVVVLQRAVQQTKGATPAVMGALWADKMSHYANLLASQGSLVTAAAYLPDGSDQVTPVDLHLRERLRRALGDTSAAPTTPSLVPGRQPATQARTSARPAFAPGQQPHSPVTAPAQAMTPAPQYYQQAEPFPPGFGMQPLPNPSVPVSAASGYMYSQQYPQIYPQVQQYSPGAGGPSIYQPQQYASPAAPPLPASSAAAVYQSQYLHPAPLHHPLPPVFVGGSALPSPSTSSFSPPPLSSGASFQHSGPGVPTSYPLPPPSGPTGTQPDSSLVPASQTTGPQNGWNDPPTLNRVPKKKVPEHYTPPAPITAPIMAPLGDPQSPSTVQPQQMNAGQPGIQPGIQNPYLTIQQPQASTPGYPAIPTMNPEGAPGGPIGDVIQSMPAEKITKKPIPEEHIILKTTFEGLIQRCLAAATDPQTKRKLDDANKRLEFLYDKLREQTLSPAIVGGLHNMARSIETRSYADGLSIHTHIVSNSNFSETSAFMPVLKVVLTQANKLGV